MPLSLPVSGKRKSQTPDAAVLLFPVPYHQLCIRSVLSNRISSEGAQFLSRNIPVQALLLFTAAPDIRKLHFYAGKLLLKTNHVGIHERLRPVNIPPCKIRLQQFGRRFNLFYRNCPILSG
ncbi:hypothetical protein D3C75_596340 [compost metagenome]